MRRLSDRTQQVVQRLYSLDSSNSWLGISHRENTIQILLNQLATANEPGALPYAVRFLLASSSNLRKAARSTVSQLMASLRPLDLIHLSNVLDRTHNWCFAAEWRRLTPQEVQDVAGTPDEDSFVAVLGLLSFHRKGFVRQEALRQLSQIEDGSELPFLLIRQNDWVDVVAADAQVAVAKRITEANLDHLIHSLGLIFHLSSFRRRDHHNLVHRVLDLLLRNANEDFLRTVIANSEKDVCRRLFDHGLKDGRGHQARLVKFGISIDDPHIRLACCRKIAVAYAGDQARSVLEQLSADTSMPVRRAAFTALAEQSPESADVIWKRALTDASRSIRELARFLLRRLGHSESDIASVYRDHLSDKPCQLPAQEGLAETAEIQDLSYFRELLNHHLPSRRVVAIRGLLRLQKESVVDVFMPLMRDSSPRVVREVRKVLGQYSYAIPGDSLLDVVLHADGEYARWNAVQLLAELGKWRSIPWLLAAAARADAATVQAAEELILWWFTPPRCNKVFTRPTAQESQEIAAAMVEHSGQVSGHVLEAISEGMHTFR